MATNKKAPTKKAARKVVPEKPIEINEQPEFEKLGLDINDQEDVKFYEQFTEEELSKIEIETVPNKIARQASIADILKRNKK